MTDDHTDDSETRVTRRAAMGGGAAAAATMMGLATGTASAQQGTEPRIQLGDDWEIDDVDRGDGTTDLELRHLPSGSTFVFDGDSQTATLPELVTDEVRGGVTGGNAVTNLFGDGLEYASGAVRVLSSIWDSANQVLTADVNNSSVVTESVSTDRLSLTESASQIRSDTTQDFSPSTVTTVEFENNYFDHLGIVDLSENGFVVGDSGEYYVKHAIRLEGDSTWTTGDSTLPAIEVNGSRVLQKRVPKVSTSTESFAIDDVLELSSGDIVRGNYWQDSGSTQSKFPNQEYNRLTISRVG